VTLFKFPFRLSFVLNYALDTIESLVKNASFVPCRLTRMKLSFPIITNSECNLKSITDLNHITLSKKLVVERLSSELLTVNRGLFQAVNQFLAAGVHQVEHHLHFTRTKHWS